MDPLGFALENFDVIGKWRTRDEGGEIDASGALPGGKAFAGPQGLKNLLLSRPDSFVKATLSRLMTYALRRGLDFLAQPAIPQIHPEAGATCYPLPHPIGGVGRSVAPLYLVEEFADGVSVQGFRWSANLE